MALLLATWKALSATTQPAHVAPAIGEATGEPALAAALIAEGAGEPFFLRETLQAKPLRDGDKDKGTRKLI